MAATMVRAQGYPVKVDRKWGLIDRNGKLIASPAYDAIHPGQADHSIVVLEGKYGLLDGNGGGLIEARYTFLRELSDALVLTNLGGNCLDGNCEGGKWGIMHLPSRASLDPQFELVAPLDRFGLARVNVGGDCNYEDCKGGRWGLVDTLANLVLPPLYEQIRYQSAREAIVKTEAGWGLFSMALDSMLIPPRYEELRRVGPNRLAMQEGDRYGVVDNAGRVIVSPQFADVQDGTYGYLSFQKGDKYGLMDSMGVQVLEPRYQYARKGEYDWILVRDEQWGLADMEGREVIGTVLRQIGIQTPGHVIVQRGLTWGVLNAMGQETVPVKFDGVQYIDDTTFLVKDRSYYKWYDQNGDITQVLTFEEFGEFVDNVAKARRKTGWGLINGYGTWLLPPKYESVQRFQRVARAKVPGRDKWQYAYYDDKGIPTKVKSFVVMRGEGEDRDLLAASSATSVGWFLTQGRGLWGLRSPSSGKVYLQPQYTLVRIIPGTNLSVATKPLENSEASGSALVDHVRGRALTEPLFRSIEDSDFRSGNEYARAVFATSGRYTLIDRKGRFLDLGKAAYVGRFQEGVARVNVGGAIAWKDEPGIDSLSSEFQYDQESARMERRYLYCEGGKWGYVDTLGNWVMPAQYDKALDFREGVARVALEGKWGLVNKRFETIVKPQYDFIDYLYASGDEVLLSVGLNRSGYGFIDEQGEISILPSFSDVGNFREGLVRFQEDGLWGFANTRGEIVIPAQYQEVGDFHEGRARFRNQRSWGYIDEQGTVLVPETYLRAGDFHGGLAWVQGDKFYGFIGRDGAMVIEPAYSQAGDFYEGLAKARRKGQWGLIDSRGKWVLPPRFYRIEPFRDELAVVQEGGDHGLIDRTGELIVKPSYREIGPFSDRLAVVRSGLEFGYIDPAGELIIPFQYPRAETFQCARAAVFLDGRWGFIDRQGSLVVENRFSKVRAFSEDRAAVRVDGAWGFIDPSGRVSVPLIYKEVGDFRQRRAAVYQEMAGWGFVNEDGTLVIPLGYEEVRPFSNGVAQVKKNGKWGLLNQYGAPMTMLKYDAIREFSEGLAAVEVKQRLGVIDASGRELVSPNYDVISMRGDRVQAEVADKVGYLDPKGNWIWEPSK